MVTNVRLIAAIILQDMYMYISNYYVVDLKLV